MLARLAPCVWYRVLLAECLDRLRQCGLRRLRLTLPRKGGGSARHCRQALQACGFAGLELTTVTRQLEQNLCDLRAEMLSLTPNHLLVTDDQIIFTEQA
jgi:hypothetical protein